MSRLRLAIITDIHNGRDTFTKRGSAALPLLRQFVDDVSGGDYDAVIDLGDRISDENRERDGWLLGDVATEFKKLKKPRYHVVGNHDVTHLLIAESQEALDAPLTTRAVNLDEVRLVFWQPNVTLTRERGLHLAEGDLQSLISLLSSDDRRTLLFSHVPLSGASMRGNYWFENNVGHATYAEIGAIRAALAEAPCPLAAMSGHVHWNAITTVDSVPHFTQQSLTETFTTSPLVAASTGIIEIEPNSITWRVSGNDSFSVKVPFLSSKRDRGSVLPPFSGMAFPPA